MCFRRAAVLVRERAAHGCEGGCRAGARGAAPCCVARVRGRGAGARRERAALRGAQCLEEEVSKDVLALGEFEVKNVQDGTPSNFKIMVSFGEFRVWARGPRARVRAAPLRTLRAWQRAPRMVWR